MAKRKYTKFGESPKGYKCTRSKCGWEGTLEQQVHIKNEKDGCTYLSCPDCEGNTFRGLLVNPNMFDAYVEEKNKQAC